MNERKQQERRDKARAFSRRDCLRLASAGASGLALGRASSAFAWPGALKGTIYVGADMRAAGENKSAVVLLAVDVASGESKVVLEGFEMRPRVSPDGRRVAFAQDHAVWVAELAPGSKPVRVQQLEDTEYGSPACWSADGKQLVVSPYHRDEKNDRWNFRTVRINADGTGKEDLPLPDLDGVWDWSADGQWLVTTSHRNAKIGWQLYVMKLDGTGDRQITEGGNPFAPRFSPDGRQVLFNDGTTEERRGIWVVDIDGKNKRKLASWTGMLNATGCWSPDGKWVALVYNDLERAANGGNLSRLEVMDLNGENRTIFSVQGHTPDDCPDWR